MNQIIKNAPRKRSRPHAAVEDSGSDSEDTEADKAEWEDILAAMGDGESEEVEVTDDERDTVCLSDPGEGITTTMSTKLQTETSDR